MAEDPTEFESGAADRLLFFSDAVVAIALTLLALELPVPTGATSEALWHSVSHESDSYLAFLISFTVIAVAWSEHHHVMRYIERSDARLRALSMFWLLTIVLTPFATDLLTTESRDSDGAHALRYGFYALLRVLGTGSFLAMVHHMISRGLQSADMPQRVVRQANWQGVGLMLGFGLSIPLFLLTRAGWVAWIVGPIVVGQLARRRHAGQDGSASHS
jgi:uncharacterized membrane protein